MFKRVLATVALGVTLLTTPALAITDVCKPELNTIERVEEIATLIGAKQTMIATKDDIAIFLKDRFDSDISVLGFDFDFLYAYTKEDENKVVLMYFEKSINPACPETRVVHSEIVVKEFLEDYAKVMERHRS